MRPTLEDARKIPAAQFIDVLKRSTLADPIPMDNPTRIAVELAYADALCTAWVGGSTTASTGLRTP